jgi:hypothetical protein
MSWDRSNFDAAGPTHCLLQSSFRSKGFSSVHISQRSPDNFGISKKMEALYLGK